MIRWFVLRARRLFLTLLAAFCAYVLLFSLAALFVKYPVGAGPQMGSNAAGAGEIRGAYHIHSTLSDGSRTRSQIAQAAKRAGLQFIVMTDHNLTTLSAPTFEHGVLVISGIEYSTWQGHLVVLGASRPFQYGQLELDPVWRAQQLGGLAILAHPVLPELPWIDSEAAARAAGMELYSGDSLFREALHSPLTLFFPATGAYLTNPMHALMILDRAQPKATRKLLEISAREPKLALCAHDAHGFPPYELQFRAFSVHLPRTGTLKHGLSSDPNEAARAVIDGITRGDAYCAFDALAGTDGFAIEGLPAKSRRAAMGDRITVRIPSSAPARSRVQLWGGARLEADGRTVVFEQAGPVQIEVWLAAPGKLFGSTWKPWIIPSPIFVSSATP